MAMMASVNKQQFLIKNLSTRSVVLYPSRAHITREIKDVVLQDGANEIEIYGLAPTVDEHSIKVEGTGLAIITDMTVNLVPNTEIFQEIYPDESDTGSELEEDESGNESDRDTGAVTMLREEVEKCQEQIEKANDKAAAAWKNLQYLDRYADTLSAEHLNPDMLRNGLLIYDEQRKLMHEAKREGERQAAALEKEYQRNSYELTKATKQTRKEWLKRQKAKRKSKEQRARREIEKRKEVARTKAERQKFWPKKVYRVVLYLETSTSDTPSTSRRSSFDSVLLAKSTDTNTPFDKSSESKVSLALSYITYEASWSPRYDISILTPSKSGSIVYRAEFFNKTSEVWKDAQVSLSTSQTSYQGLDDAVPYMSPWHVHLQKGNQDDSGMTSRDEQVARSQQHFGQSGRQQFNRNELFGVDTYQHARSSLHLERAKRIPAQLTSTVARRTASAQLSAAPAMAAAVASHTQAMGPQNAMAAQRLSTRARPQHEEQGDPRDAFEAADTATLNALEAPLEFEESTWEDYGLTTTYEVPGTRTLSPSSLSRRHKIATLAISNLIMTSICVPKLRPAAFMRARFRNPSSSITLLKGTAGLSLDGSFLGNTDFPRVSPNEHVTLPLGVDAALHVSYAKPTVLRSSQGLFNKEKTQVFTRNIWLTNTHPTPVELLVLDQIPVSDDERLHVELKQPLGLVKENDFVKTGESARKLQAGESWGKATATLKKRGEIAWDIKIEKGRSCLLTLKYEARAPAAESISTT